MSAILDGIAGLKATLEAAAGLASVTVYDRPVEEAEEVTSADGTNAVMYIAADMTVERTIPYMKAGVVDIDEEWTLTLVTQVWSDTLSQLDVDTLCFELQLAAMQAVGTDPTLGVSDLTVMHAHFDGSGTVHRGRLNGQGHGCRTEDQLSIVTRTTAS